MSSDPYCYPGTNVLINRLNIRDPEALKAAESRIAAFALFVLLDEPLTGAFSEQRFRATHHAIFANLYSWAGAYRQNIGTMTKARSLGYRITYGDSTFVPAEMSRIFDELAMESFLQGLPPKTFAARLAYFYSEIDAVHPFREGNSRTLRQFTSDLASSAAYRLDWEPLGASNETRNALYTARDQAVQLGDLTRLESIILHNLHSH